MTIHHTVEPNPDLSVPDPHQDTFSRTILGFWIYLMTDCLLFATLFATYAVLHQSTFGGPGPKDLFELPYVFLETMILLLSSLFCGLSVIATYKNNKIHVLGWLILTFILGASFIALEFHEFADLIGNGHSFRQSAFLSAFFTLVGTHGLHVSFGLLWILVLFFQIIFLGINTSTFRRLVTFSLFWHFLDLIWIFIFTFVYLMGVN